MKNGKKMSASSKALKSAESAIAKQTTIMPHRPTGTFQDFAAKELAKGMNRGKHTK